MEENWLGRQEMACAPADDYTSYETATSNGDKCSFRAPFDGTHGWYWRNRANAPVTILAKASGSFSKFEPVAKK